MKQPLLLFLFTFFSIITTLGQQRATRSNAAKNGRIYGKVVNSKTNKGLESASVQIAIPVPGNTNDPAKDSIIAGMFTKGNGDFSFENIPFTNSLKLLITAIGYSRAEHPLQLNRNAGMGNQRPERDLGNFKVEPEAQLLANVTVTATRPAMEMGIDRRVFNVEKSITSAGGTAIDVMRNIPSVTVDVEGNVQLRNTSPQIFVDGRPTVLTLDQIPADNIERVEIVTNPSAKFDAASTGGIINVVLKKNRRVGLNGTASVSGGSPDILGGNLTLNLRQGKFNLFASGNYNRSGGRAAGETFRQNKSNGVVQNYFNQFSWSDRLRRFSSARFGFDFFLDNRNTITLSENFVKGRFSNNEEQNQEYLTSSNILDRTGERISEGAHQFNRSSTRLEYTHKFANPGRTLSADVSYNIGNGGNETSIVNSYFDPEGSPYSLPNRVRNSGQNDNTQFNAQVDYVNPIGENAKLETGFRTFIQNNTSIFNAFALDQANQETKLPLSNHYKYRERVNAFYVTFSNKINKFSYQAGVRAEQSKFDGELVDKQQKFGYEYPSDIKNIWDALFPSLFLTQTIGDREDIQLNYTRRIRRPNFWNLNPFLDINDPVNLRQGNPTLRPEFTNSFEFNYNKTYKSGSLLGVIYYRNNLGDITQYSDTISTEQYQQLNNAAVEPNAILNTFINAKSTNRLGLELTWQQKLAKNFEVVPNINLQHRKVNADIKGLNLSNEGFNWEAKLITNYKIETQSSRLFNNLGFQVIGEYESPSVIPQGKRKEQYSVDFALRKDMFKDKKGSLTFSVNDVFNTNRFGIIYDTKTFYQDLYRRRNVRSFRLTFTYRFGSTNFNLFRRGQNRSEDSEEEDSPI